MINYYHYNVMLILLRSLHHVRWVDDIFYHNLLTVTGVLTDILTLIQCRCKSGGNEAGTQRPLAPDSRAG